MRLPHPQCDPLVHVWVYERFVSSFHLILLLVHVAGKEASNYAPRTFRRMKTKIYVGANPDII